MLSVIIAAGALFTAVYDVLYKYNTTNTTILNAATDMTGKTNWEVTGSGEACNETTTLNFDDGTYIVVFGAQHVYGHSDWGYSRSCGATCLALYKGSSMSVTIGAGVSLPGGSYSGSCKTIVKTNFATPSGYAGGGDLDGVAGGGGDGAYYSGVSKHDGVFAGWEGNSYSETRAKAGVIDECGMPATQSHNGYRYDGVQTQTVIEGHNAGRGGFGYYDGGGGYTKNSNYARGGGGSCSPYCYPIYSGDIQNGGSYQSGTTYRYYDTYNHGTGQAVYVDYNVSGDKFRWLLNKDGSVQFFRIDPDRRPTAGNAVVYGNTVRISTPGSTRYTPVTAIQNLICNEMTLNGSHKVLSGYDCGIRTGWVYSCSEDGEKWGASSETKMSKTFEVQHR